MRVFALASYPVEAAATRFRLTQFVDPLAARGITLTIHPYLDSRAFAGLYVRSALPRTLAGLVRGVLRRGRDVIAARKADVVLVQREAMLVGPPVVEWFLAKVADRPTLLDLDDGTYLPYNSTVFGPLPRLLKSVSKTDHLIRWASMVSCGNRTIAQYAGSRGGRVTLLPSAVNTERFVALPRRPPSPIPVVGWIGTHSTYPYLRSILPALQRLGEKHRFRLRIVGSGVGQVEVPGVPTESARWALAREVADFQSLDIGLYPIVPNEWAVAKSALKSVLYMAVGIPFVASPVGAAAETGIPGVTHFLATSPEEWVQRLSELLSDVELRARMGAAGREYVVERHSLPVQAPRLVDALETVASGGHAAG
jgi:glycosyltransferase involved in cell wall biosynthesis